MGMMYLAGLELFQLNCIADGILNHSALFQVEIDSQNQYSGNSSLKGSIVLGNKVRIAQQTILLPTVSKYGSSTNNVSYSVVY